MRLLGGDVDEIWWRWGSELGAGRAVVGAYALVYGLLSALSLPLGAAIGIWVSPIPQWVTACCMAFGAGALVYAVSTELFGEALFLLNFSGETQSMEGGCGRVCVRRFWDLWVQSCSAVVGAVVYIFLDRWLNKSHSTEGGGRRPSRTGENMSSAGCPDEEGGDHSKGGDGGGHGSTVAVSMWLGLVLDGIPESLMIGFMTVEGTLGLELLVAIFIANFPEAFSGAALLRQAGMPVWKIMGMWLFILAFTGVLAMVAAMVLPADVVVDDSREMASTLPGRGLHGRRSPARVLSISSAAAEGVTAGSMLAMVCTAMLPEAFAGVGHKSGLFFVLGFVVSVSVSVVSVRIGGPEAFLKGHH